MDLLGLTMLIKYGVSNQEKLRRNAETNDSTTNQISLIDSVNSGLIIETHQPGVAGTGSTGIAQTMPKIQTTIRRITTTVQSAEVII